MTKQDWRYLLFLLAAHHPKEKLDHTICLGLRNKKIYFCSRCTGAACGMAVAFGLAAFGWIFPSWLYLPFIALLPLTAVVDWFTQSAKKRKSNTSIRLTTGFLLGIGEALALELLVFGFYLQFMVAVGLALAYVLCVYLIAYRTRCLDAYVNEMNRF
jgi:uncharacterized membrane protein